MESSSCCYRQSERPPLTACSNQSLGTADACASVRGGCEPEFLVHRVEKKKKNSRDVTKSRKWSHARRVVALSSCIPLLLTLPLPAPQLATTLCGLWESGEGHCCSGEGHQGSSRGDRQAQGKADCERSASGGKCLASRVSPQSSKHPDSMHCTLILQGTCLCARGN